MMIARRHADDAAEDAMAKGFFRSGKQTRPKTAVRGKRYLCAVCRKRSPKPVKTPAPWYCPRCQAREASSNS